MAFNIRHLQKEIPKTGEESKGGAGADEIQHYTEMVIYRSWFNGII